MNTTAIISAEIQVSDIPIFEALFKRLRAKKIVVESKKDDTEMTEEEFLAKIDRSMKSKRTKVTVEELRAKYLKKS